MIKFVFNLPAQDDLYYILISQNALRLEHNTLNIHSLSMLVLCLLEEGMLLFSLLSIVYIELKSLLVTSVTDQLALSLL